MFQLDAPVPATGAMDTVGGVTVGPPAKSGTHLAVMLATSPGYVAADLTNPSVSLMVNKTLLLTPARQTLLSNVKFESVPEMVARGKGSCSVTEPKYVLAPATEMADEKVRSDTGSCTPGLVV
jgi:hypothetical protein